MPDATRATDTRQLSLWESPSPPPPPSGSAAPSPAYAHGSRTSAAAAASVAHLTRGMRAQIYEHILHCADGAIREEIATALQMRLSSVTARVNELLKLGAICERGTRRTSSGRAAAVLITKTGANPDAGKS